MKLEDCKCNFRSPDGKPYLVRCPNCDRENYSMAVSSGICAWCGWKATVEPEQESEVNNEEAK
jgi:hypothetical protein